MAMNLFTGSNFDPFMREMERTMNRVFENQNVARPTTDLMTLPTFPTLDLPFRTTGSTGMVVPMDIYEKDNSFELLADAPGMKPDEVSVEVENGVLSIHGEHKETKADRNRLGKIVRTERVTRSFTRSFTLPENVRQDDICAALEHGVLKVTVPKVPEPEKPKPKRITVMGHGEMQDMKKMEEGEGESKKVGKGMGGWEKKGGMGKKGGTVPVEGEEGSVEAV